MNTNTEQNIFEKANFKEIFFKPEWHNGTGYFDPLAKTFIGLENVHTIDDQNRHVLIMPLWSKQFDDQGYEDTIFYGNLVIFQRYAGNWLIVINTPPDWNTDRDHRNAIIDTAIAFTAVPELQFHSAGMAALSMFVMSHRHLPLVRNNKIYLKV